MSTPSEAQLTTLLEAAHTAAHNAYAPYSHFRVGAAILLQNPAAIVTGCNVENASYRLTTCAEQTAIASAVVQHGPQIRILAVAVSNLNGAACQPCGACRQTILEFAGPDTPILFPGPSGQPDQQPLSALLPASFSFAPADPHLEAFASKTITPS